MTTLLIPFDVKSFFYRSKKQNSSDAYDKTIEKAIENIVKSIEKCTDAYALAVSAYALQLAGHSSKNDVIARLKDLAKLNGRYAFH